MTTAEPTDPYQKYKKDISKIGKIKRKAIIRGLFFLALCVVITYIGKFRPKTYKLVSDHGLLVWVFYGEDHLSSLIIYPNDGDNTNKTLEGQRVFINPLNRLEPMDSNYIQYQPKDIFLLGKVKKEHIALYCTQVRPPHTLYYQGDSSWAIDCAGSQLVDTLASRLIHDEAVQAYMVRDSLTGSQAYYLNYLGQKICFSAGSKLCSPSSSLSLTIHHDIISNPLILDSTAFSSATWLAPGLAFYSGKLDSNLILQNEHQALGIRQKNSGELEIKKIWLKF